MVDLTHPAHHPSAIRPKKFLSIRDVLDKTSISRSLLYELIKDPQRPFPSPVHIGRRSVWIEGEVEQYMAEVVADERS
jgi:predicted DNA-binding transcriptional regulator AlpA